MLLLGASAAACVEPAGSVPSEAAGATDAEPQALITGIDPIQPELGFVDQPHASTLHVARTGCSTPTGACPSTNTGATRETAIPSIQQAATLAGPGTRILVYPESTPYDESIAFTSWGDHAAGGNSTTGAKRIIGVEVKGQKPKVSPSTAVDPFSVSAGYVVIENLEIDCRGQLATGVNATLANHVALRNLTIHHCNNDAILVRGSEHVLVQGGAMYTNRKIVSGVRQDASAVHIEISKKVLVKGVTGYDNTGDGVHIAGREQEAQPGEPYDPSEDSFDITIEDSTFHHNDENAVDIKSCTRCAVRGANKFWGFSHSANNGGSCGGAAVVVHFWNNGTTIQDAEIHDSGIGIMVGREDSIGDNLVIRRNRIRNLNQNLVPTSEGRKYNCGDGIAIRRIRHAEIYHNTIDGAEHSGIAVANSSSNTGTEDVRIWNNVITNVKGNAYFNASASTPDYTRTEDTGGYIEVNEKNVVTPVYIDYNHYHAAAGEPFFRRTYDDVVVAGRVHVARMPFTYWKATTAYDAHGSAGDRWAPMWSAAPATDGYRLAAGSGAISTALADDTNLSQRCAAGPDKGAVESDCSGPGATPAPPLATTPAGPGKTWSKQLGTSGNDEVAAVVGSADGTVWVVGSTEGDLGGTPSQGARDVYVQRYQAHGVDPRKRVLPSTGDDVATTAVVDSAGNLYVAGWTTGVIQGSNKGMKDFFIAKWNAEGTRLWRKQDGTTKDDLLHGLAVDATGTYVYAVGSTDGGYLGTENPGGEYGSTDALIVKFSAADGAVVDHHQSAEYNPDRWFDVAFVGSDLLVSGTEMSYPRLARFDAALSPVWSTGGVTSSTGDCITNWSGGLQLGVDASGNAFVAGFDCDAAVQDESAARVARINGSGQIQAMWPTHGIVGDLSAGKHGEVLISGWTNTAPTQGFTAKFTSAGGEIWRDTYAAATTYESRRVSLDALGRSLEGGTVTTSVYGPLVGGKDGIAAVYP